METCEICGFIWELVARNEIGPRVHHAATDLAARLRAEPVRALRRPSAQRWSMLEYGAHVRDVLLTIRDRLVIGLVEENPDFKPLYRDERIALGLYGADATAPVADELEASAAMLVRLFNAIDAAALTRPVKYGFPGPQQRTLLWMGQQAVHEAEHHRDDAAENLRLLDVG